jgi:predicted dehydrogenase
MSNPRTGAAATSQGDVATATGARLRAGVVGLGYGRKHIDSWRQHPDVDVVAIADIDSTRLEASGNQFGISARYASAAMRAASVLEILDAIYESARTRAPVQIGS